MSALIPAGHPDGYVVGRAFHSTSAVEVASGRAHLTGLRAAAGQVLVPSNGRGAELHVTAMAFDSPASAAAARDYLRRRDVAEQPSLMICSLSARQFKIPGVPGAVATHRLPVRDRSGAAPAVEMFAAEYTTGPVLHRVSASIAPGAWTEAGFARAVRSVA